MQSTYSSKYAFAALKADGSVVTWGVESDGGDSSKVKDHLTSGVQCIMSHGEEDDYAFAAVKYDRTIVFWGQENAKSGVVRKACDFLGLDLGNAVILA